MECLYIPQYLDAELIFQIPEDERKHLKALRIKDGEEMMISNGKGIAAFGKIHYDEKWNASFHQSSVIEEYGELSSNFSIFVCNLHHKERLEFIVEKATELGAKELFIYVCKYSQTDKIDLKRLGKLAITAMKQSKRARLMQIIPLSKDEKLSELFSKYSNVLLLDENGGKPLGNPLIGDTLILVGPEGGFHETEMEFFYSIPNIAKWNLGQRRLRTETAVLKALSIITSMNE